MHLHIFNFKGLLSMIVNISCSHAFSTIKGLFSWDVFVKNDTRTRKKIIENKVLKQQNFISRDFIFLRLFSTGLLKCQNLGLYFQKLYFREPWLIKDCENTSQLVQTDLALYRNHFKVSAADIIADYRFLKEKFVFEIWFGLVWFCLGCF